MGSLGRDERLKETLQNKRISPGFALNLTHRHRWQCATCHCLSEEGASSAAGGTSPNGTKLHPAEELPRKASWSLPRVGRVTCHPANPTLRVCPSARRVWNSQRKCIKLPWGLVPAHLFHKKLLTEDRP